MRKELRLIASLLILSALFILSACSSMHIEDTNGDDTAVVTLGDTDLLSGTDSSVANFSTSNRQGNNITGSIGKLSGVYTLHKVTLREGDGNARITVDLELSEGNLRLAVVSGSGEIRDITETSREVILPEGDTYRVRVLAESAKFTYGITVEFGVDAE